MGQIPHYFPKAQSGRWIVSPCWSVAVYHMRGARGRDWMSPQPSRRDGVPPIELVDGEILVDMFEKLELGLIPKRDFDVDEKFFEEYKK